MGKMIKISRTKPIYIRLNPNYYMDSYSSDGSTIFNIMNSEGIEVVRIIMRGGKLYKVIEFRNEKWGKIEDLRA